MGITLRQRIFWWSVASTLVILVVAFFFVDEAFRTTILKDREQNMSVHAQLVAIRQNGEVEAAMERTANLGTTPTLRAALETGDSLTVRQNLDRLLTGSEMDWLVVVKPDGSVLAATAGVPRDRIADSATLGLVEEAQFYDTGDLWLHDGRLVQVHASGIFLGPTLVGVLLSGLSVGDSRVTKLEAGAQQKIAFVANGRIVAGGDTLTAAEQQALIQMVYRSGEPEGGNLDTMALLEADQIHQLELGGHSFLAATVPLPSAKGTRVGSIVTFGSLEEALAPVGELRLALILIASIGVFLAFGSSFMLSHRVTDPVNKLLHETVRLGSGNLDHPIVPAAHDEIGALASGFEQMRLSLRDAREKLVRAERLSAVGRAASAIVHDFRQPVTVIQGYITLLKEVDEDPEERAEDLAIIDRELSRLNAMMREILDFANGGESIRRTEGSVSRLLEELEESVRPLLEAKEICLNVESVYSGEWSFDYPRMRRVLENLVRNAAAVVEPGGRVTVHSGVTPEGLRFVVEDTGPGIPEEVHETLFEPFVTFGNKEGTGLGLAIVRSFTERHGGTVRFETSSNGTRFLLDFPKVVLA